MKDELIASIAQAEELSKQGNFPEAIAVAAQALTVARTSGLPGEPYISESLMFLATLHFGGGDPKLAEPLIQEALSIRRAALGDRHPAVILTRQHLAALNWSLKSYTKAAALYEEVLAAQHATLDPTDPAIATTDGRLANAILAGARSLDRSCQESFENADFAEAARTAAELQDFIAHYLGEGHVYYATALLDLGRAYSNLGNPTKAETTLREALTILAPFQNNAPLDYGTALLHLAKANQQLGDNQHAIDEYSQVIELSRKNIDERDAQSITAIALNNLGSLYELTSGFNRAESVLHRSLEMTRALDGEASQEFATTLHNLARFYQHAGHYARSIELYLQAIDILHTVLEGKGAGADRIRLRLAEFYDSLSSGYVAMGDYFEAYRPAQLALRVQRDILGPNHPDLAPNLFSLSRIREAAGDYPASLSFAEQAVSLWRSARGPEHPLMVSGLGRLGLVHRKMGHLRKAQTLYEQAWQLPVRCTRLLIRRWWSAWRIWPP